MTGVGEKPANTMIRPARRIDARGIRALLLPFVASGIVLPRSEEEIQNKAGDFLVAEDRTGVVGCVALYDYGNGLQEVRSLTVRQDRQGQGLGSRLVAAAIELAVERRTERLFALTLRDHFFVANGFRVVPKEMFPEKVWKDCVVCPKRDCCDEIAVLLEMPEIYN
jgi:amino-acid N-acetyltransferase